MPSFNISDWYPQGSLAQFSDFTKFKRLKKHENEEGAKPYPIDEPDDIEKYGIAFTPAANFCFAGMFTALLDSSYSYSGSKAWFMLLIGDGEVIRESSDQWQWHFEREYTRLIFSVQLEPLFGAPMVGMDPWGGLGGVTVPITGLAYVDVPNIYDCRYDPSITDGKYPKDIFGQMDHNLLLGQVLDGYKIMLPFDISGAVRPLDNFGTKVEIDIWVKVLSPAYKSAAVRYEPAQITYKQDGSFNELTWGASKDKYWPIPQGAQMKMFYLKQMRGFSAKDDVFTAIKVLRGGPTQIWSGYDKVTGIRTDIYNDVEGRMLLSRAKVRTAIDTKILLDKDDPGKGINGGMWVYGSGNRYLVWEKSGGPARPPAPVTIGTGPAASSSGTGATGATYPMPIGVTKGTGPLVYSHYGDGIWCSQVIGVDEGTGPVRFRGIGEDSAPYLYRDEWQLIKKASNPVPQYDPKTGMRWIFYWQEKRPLGSGDTGYVPPYFFTTGTGGTAAATAGTGPLGYGATGQNLGAIYVAWAKGPTGSLTGPHLAIPYPNDNTTKVNQQSVGVLMSSPGRFEVTWIDSESHAQRVMLEINESQVKGWI